MSKEVETPVVTATIPTGQATAPAPAPIELKTSGMATASMVCGIIGVFIFGIVLGPLAIIFGFIAIYKIKQGLNKLQGRCQAISGIVCGFVAIAIRIALIIWWVNYVNDVATSDSGVYYYDDDYDGGDYWT